LEKQRPKSRGLKPRKIIKNKSIKPILSKIAATREIAQQSNMLLPSPSLEVISLLPFSCASIPLFRRMIAAALRIFSGTRRQGSKHCENLDADIALLPFLRHNDFAGR
jgi:hypothetical protein